jgi:hypothetical protein
MVLVTSGEKAESASKIYFFLNCTQPQMGHLMRPSWVLFLKPAIVVQEEKEAFIVILYAAWPPLKAHSSTFSDMKICFLVPTSLSFFFNGATLDPKCREDHKNSLGLPWPGSACKKALIVKRHQL